MADIIEKPWGFERILFSQDGSHIVKHLVVKPGARLSFQYHRQKVETMILVEGEASLMIMHGHRNDVYKMEKFVPYHIKPNVAHRIKSVGASDAVIAEVSSYFPDDVQRLDDDYGRVN